MIAPWQSQPYSVTLWRKTSQGGTPYIVGSGLSASRPLKLQSSISWIGGRGGKEDQKKKKKKKKDGAVFNGSFLGMNKFCEGRRY